MDNHRLEKKLSLASYLILILAYPLGYYFHYYFEDYYILDSLYVRFGFSLFCILILVVDKVFNNFILQTRLFQILHIVTLIYSHYLVYLNSLGLSYILGLSVIVINVMSLANSKRFLNLYFALNTICTNLVFIFVNEHKENPLLFLIALVSLTFFEYNNRRKDLELISELLMREQREIQTNEEKNLFFARVIHEIRNPINAIFGIIEELKEKGTNLEIQKEINILSDSTEILLNLLNDLLDLSKLERGHIEFHFSPCSPKQIAKSVFDLFYFRAKRKGLELEYEFIGVDLLYNGEPIRIKQILMNLLNNAINYTSHGRILISVRNELENNLLHSTYKVYDTGSGISKENRDKVFQKFYRANNEVKGAGLGLYISKTLAELMSGSLTFESPPTDREDFNTVFILDLRFPVIEGEVLSTQEETYLSLPIRRVLIVDDDEVNLVVLSQIMKSLRINFSIANT
ncbi:MAG: HAMP domain-containing histidine kinase, partial [Leptospiraceae bacterium]|nr:HAMP domain-containing histidine kinase [Leptospiraceae bacterium]